MTFLWQLCVMVVYRTWGVEPEGLGFEFAVSSLHVDETFPN